MMSLLKRRVHSFAVMEALLRKCSRKWRMPYIVLVWKNAYPTSEMMICPHDVWTLKVLASVCCLIPLILCRQKPTRGPQLAIPRVN